jgi:hypothetical protein
MYATFLGENLVRIELLFILSPRKISHKEICEHIADSFEVISSRWF